MYYYGIDPTYILVLIGAVLCMMANAKVQSSFQKYSKIRSVTGLTGAEAASRILAMSGIHDVRIEHISGNLTDHYDPRSKTLRLSDPVYGSGSLAAIGVAAHECGHAVQHHEGYVPLKMRSSLVPAANLGSRLGIPIVIIGIILGIGFELPGGTYFSIATLGVWIFSLAVLFQIVTLPVEWNASSRALSMLNDYGLMGKEEIRGCRSVLSAAALTYVAAAASSILQLLRLILLSNRRSRRD